MDRLLDLFTTFRMTFSTDDAGLWQHFRITSLSEQVASLLASGQLQAAIMICSRHEVRSVLNVVVVTENSDENLRACEVTTHFDSATPVTCIICDRAPFVN